MARTLVKAKTGYLHPDVYKSLSGNYRKGYPVISFDDGHIFGRLECLPDFIIVETPGVDKFWMARFEKSVTELKVSNNIFIKNDPSMVVDVIRRRYRYPNDLVDIAINNKGFLLMSKKRIKKSLIDQIYILNRDLRVAV